MNLSKLYLMGLLVLGTAADAATRSPLEFGQKSLVKIKDVTLSESVNLNAGTKPVSLKRVASGLRYKKVAFITANVYVGQLFSNAKINQSSLIDLKDSIVKELPAVITMTFLRDVPAEKLSNGFKETLSESGVKIDQAPYPQFLEAVKNAGEMKEGETYEFIYQQNSFIFSAHGNEYYKLDAANSDALSGFLMVWFGKAPDSGLESLQKDLLKP